MQLFVTVRGETVGFETPHTDAEALKRLNHYTAAGGLLGDSTFARDLASKQARSGLSGKQMAWVHKLVIDAENPKPKPAGPAADLKGVVALFDKAAQTLKYPAITIDLGDGRVLRLSRCGDTSKHTGAVNVTNGAKDQFARVWYGRIERDGSYTAGRAMDDWVRSHLEELSADPAGYAAAYGRKSGRCCFCNTALTDDRSTAVGYGPVCAKKYGLTWGAKEPAKDDAQLSLSRKYGAPRGATVDPDADVMALV